MKIFKATRKYEKWLRQELNVFEDDFLFKTARLKDDPSTFLRGTFYRWMQLWGKICKKIATAPVVLSVGDLHAANFGSQVRRFVYAIHQMARAFLHKGTVHDKQLLQRRGRVVAGGAVRGWIGKIEEPQHGAQLAAFDGDVQRPTVVRRIVEIAVGAADREIQTAGGRQHPIPPGFNIKPPAVGPPQEPVVGIDGNLRRVQ
jgi:hypothetical protein